jgi:uncharacterized protein YgiM (DUF1202 family)
VRGSLLTIVSLALLAASCADRPEHAPPIGEAFVGPAVLKIRSDIPLQAAVVTTVKHGDRLEILQQRRRFLRVRTTSGVEGWTDERQLLAAEDMQKLKDLAVRAQQMTVQGQATTFGELNVHTQPSRQSPSFLQVKENEKIDVLMHTTAPRVELSRKPLIAPPPKKAKTEEKKAPKESKYPPLPLPKPPSPPANWLELSKTDLAGDDLDDEQEGKPEQPAAAHKPVPTDDWSLIRTKSGESGWALTRRLVMAIPDDVAQYAEGRRIVSYFSLGTVEDGDEKKQNWLWTTIGDGSYPYDFDSFRVFIWSLRRHRYETAYIERNLHGYAPVLLRDVELSAGKAKGAEATTVKYPGFSVCMEKKDGQRYRRDYAFITNVVRYAGEQSCDAPPVPQNAASPAPLKVGPESQPTESLMKRARNRLRALTRRWMGK